MHLNYAFFLMSCYGLPSPRGVRVASNKINTQTRQFYAGCRPRKGCGLHQRSNSRGTYRARFVAVPVRGAGCIEQERKNHEEVHHQLPSPRGVRVASAKGYKPVSAHLSVPYNGNVKKCAVGKHPKSEKHGNTAQFSEVERSGTQENCGGIGSGCRLRLRPLPVLRRRQSQRVARIDPNAVVVDKNIAENDRFDLFSR